jgi:hypothetical protein
MIDACPSLLISNQDGPEQQQPLPRGQRPNGIVLHLEQTARTLPHLPLPQKDAQGVPAPRTDLQRPQGLRSQLGPTQETTRSERPAPHQPCA